jgi:murein L,D-transpeptidase YcbB/YkuD
MRVVVGHRDRPTPSLSGEISRVVFNPTWSVPATIAVEDLLPRQREDPQFLPRHRIRVFTGNGPAVREVAATSMTWNGLDPLRFPYRLVQDAGAANSLGRIKIAFENPFDIYLHDTPAKGMFDLSTRTLSSGCVRLEDAAALATLLMANDRPWNESDTAARVQVGETRTLNLERTLPIYLVYMTVWSDGDGELRFGRDIYDRDAVVLSAIRARGASTASN